ncbi:MAG: MFS transporter [Micrococcales bacterium]|nr:MFS transporter [Micrococcales bacterium]
MRSTFSSLRFRNYRLWFTGALVSNIGTWMQRTAQDWLVLTQLTHNSGIALGVVTALQFAPVLALSPWAGLLADRMDRRKLLMATQGAMGLFAAVLGTLVLSGQVRLWHVYALALALGVASAFDSPVRQTFVGQLVPRQNLPNAVGLNSASFNSARLVGPGVAGLLIAAIGTGWMFWLNAVSFACTIAALVAMRPSELHPMPKVPRSKRQIRAGMAYVRHRPDILVILAVVGVVSAFGLNFQVTTALMARTVFDKGASQYGLLGSIMAIGSLSGALLAARREHPRVRLVVAAATGFGVAACVLSLMPSYWAYAVMLIPVGLASLTMMTAANATIQMSTEPQMRGRVMALYMMVFQGATPIGSPIIGWVGQEIGARWAIGVGGISAILIALVALAWAGRCLHLRVCFRPDERPHLLVTADEHLVGPEVARVG